MERSAAVLFCLAVSGANLSAARADFVIELANGGTIVAESYAEDGADVRVYRPGGELRLDRARIRAIRDRGAVAGAAEPSSAPSAPANAEAAASPPPPEAAPPAAGASASRPPSEGSPRPVDRAELAALEGQLTRELILANRDLLFARNRGEPEQELERRRQEIQGLEKRRREVRALLGW